MVSREDYWVVEVGERSTGRALYTLFQAIGIVFGIASLLFVVSGLMNMDFSQMLMGFLFSVAKKVTSSIFSGMASLI